jgi:aminoglycoside adenylyltransferase-like protein
MSIFNAFKSSAILDRIREGIDHQFGDTLAGLYLYGSLVSGDFVTGISDLDLLAVTTRDLHDDDVAPLEALHAAIVAERPEWADRIEIAYLSAQGLKTFKTARSPLIIISPGEPLHLIDAGSDWLMNWYLIRTSGVALYGPPVSEVIPLITQQEYLQAVRAHLSSADDWIARATSRKPGSYAVLTAARGYYTLTHGEHASKAKTAVWMKEQFPEWAGLIDRALAWRVMPLDQPLTNDDRREIAAYLSIVTRLIRDNRD